MELENGRRGSADCYFTSLALELLPKRDKLASILEGVGMHPVIPEGGYFMLADISPIVVPGGGGGGRAVGVNPWNGWRRSTSLYVHV